MYAIFFNLLDTVVFLFQGNNRYLMIGLFEMVIIRKQKGKRTDILWIAFSIFLVVLFVLGFTLPQGFDLLR